MKLLNTLLLLARPQAPITGVAAGALYNDGSAWNAFGQTGFPEDILSTYTVPDNRQVTYFDRFQNDGVLTIVGTGTLVGFR
jgi:hypothetical protein